MNMNHKPKRQPVPFTDADGVACLHVPLASGHGPATIEAADLPGVLAAGVTLAWNLNDNGSGRRYVRANQMRGNTVMVARLIMGAGPEHEAHYRDGDPLNLRRANLYLTGRRGRPLPTDQAAAEPKHSAQTFAGASDNQGGSDSPPMGARASTPADAVAIRGQA